MRPLPTLSLLLIAHLHAAKATDDYADSVLYLEALEMKVDGDYQRENQAHLNLDIKVQYSDPPGSQILRAEPVIQLMDSGAKTFGLPTVTFTISNPEDVFRVEAIPSLNYFNRDNKVETLPAAHLFTLSPTNFNTTKPTAANASFSKSGWSLSLTYRKACSEEHHYGFQCNVQCLPPRERECYTCDTVTGRKICCNSTDVDQGTCAYKGGVVPPGRTCEERYALLLSDYNESQRLYSLYFWLFLTFIILAVLFILLFMLALLTVCYYRRKYYELREYHLAHNNGYQAQRSYTAAVSALNQQQDRRNVQVDAYDRSLRRNRRNHQELNHGFTPDSPTPERKRRRFSDLTADTDSQLDYLDFSQRGRPPNGARPRKGILVGPRIEQFV